MAETSEPTLQFTQSEFKELMDSITKAATEAAFKYQVSEDARSGIRSDPNRRDDPEYIVRLVGQVVHVSRETVKIVAGLPEEFTL